MNVDTLRETGLKPAGAADADSAAEAPVCLEFDGGRIEPSRNLVRLNGETISLEPRTMEVLAYLATHSGHVVSKAELLANVWEGRWVAGDALSVYIYELRKALGDDARSPRFVETVRKRGYRWMPPIRVEALPLAVRGVHDAGDSKCGDVVGVRLDALAPSEVGGVKTGGMSRDALLTAGGALAAVAALAVALVSPAGPDRTPQFVTAEMPGLESPADGSFEVVSDEHLALTELHRGNEFFRGRSPKDLLRAESAYLRSTELDPSLAEAWGGLAATYAMMAEYPMRDRFELYHQARRAAEKSFELDPDAPVGHVAMAMIRLVVDWDRDKAREHITKALEVRPDLATPWEIRGWIETSSGEYDAASVSLQRAIAIDPHSANLHTLLAFVRGMAGDEVAMRAALDRAVELDRSNHLVRWYGWMLYWAQGDHEGAVPWLLATFELAGNGEAANRLRTAYRDGGVDGLLTAYRSILPQNGNLIEWARIAVYFDQTDGALDLLERAAAERDSSIVWLASYPDLRALQDEPRYQKLVEQVGGRL